MHIAVRSSVASGVALVGVGAIAFSPVQPIASPLSNVHLPAALSATSVELTATFNPLAPWIDVITAAASNAATLGEDWLANPFPALRQLGTNVIGYAETTVTALGGAVNGAYHYLTSTVPTALVTATKQALDGDLAGAASTINDAISASLLEIGFPLFDVVSIPGQIADHLAGVVKAVTGIETLVGVVLGALGPVEGGIKAFGDSAQAVLDAVQAGEVVTALNAAFAVVPNVLGAVLNGYGEEGAFPGLLTPSFGGLVQSLVIAIPQAIATALGAPAPTAALKTAAAVAAADPTTAKDSVGKASKRPAAPAASATAETVSEPTTDSSADADGADAVKDGNKVEPGKVGDSGANGTGKASKASDSGAGSAKASSNGSAGKARSSRHAAGGDK